MLNIFTVSGNVDELGQSKLLEDTTIMLVCLINKYCNGHMILTPPEIIEYGLINRNFLLEFSKNPQGHFEIKVQLISDTEH